MMKKYLIDPSILKWVIKEKKNKTKGVEAVRNLKNIDTVVISKAKALINFKRKS